MTVSVGQLLAGKYKVERELGRGGMGVVFLAENTAIGRKVALKVLLPDVAEDEGMVERFRQEARAAAAIGHPGIVDVLDLGRSEEGDEFIVMEFLRGESLRDWLGREEQLSVRDTIETMLPLLDALTAAHARGIVHRDLKPDNIFIAREPTHAVKILDFGISKLLTRNADEVLTDTGAVMGTPHYMPPEQARGLRELDASADLYALGAIIYRVLVGEPMFSGSYTEVLLKLIGEQPPRIDDARSDVPRELSELVCELVAKSPQARPPLSLIKRKLEAILQTLAPRGEQTEPPLSTSGRAKHRPITPLRGPLSHSLAEDDTIAPAGESELEATLPPEPSAAAPAATPAATPAAASSATPAAASSAAPATTSAVREDVGLTRAAAAPLFAPGRRMIAGGAFALLGAGVLLFFALRHSGSHGASHDRVSDGSPRSARLDTAPAAKRAVVAADSTPRSSPDAGRDTARALRNEPDMARKPHINKRPDHKPATKRARPSGKKTPVNTKTPAKNDDSDKPKTKISDDENLFKKRGGQP